MFHINFKDHSYFIGTNFPYPSHSPNMTLPRCPIWAMRDIFGENPPATIHDVQKKFVKYVRGMEQPRFWNKFDILHDHF